MLAVTSLVAASSAAASFCATGVVRNYLKPLEEMPRLHSVPLTNDLPFGPSGLFVGERAVGPLVSDETIAGFSLSFGSRSEMPSPRLDWTVVARLVRVARRERKRRLIERRVERVRRLGPHDNRRFTFRVSRKPSLYRLEIELRGRDGRRLGRFGRYLRVLRPRRDARLALAKTSFRHGETVSPRLENFGTESLLYGLGYRIDSYDGPSWTPSPSFPPRPVPLIGLRTGPGEAGSCWRFKIPDEAPPGLYRFVWSGRTSRGTIPDRNARLTLTSEFRILPSS